MRSALAVVAALLLLVGCDPVAPAPAAVAPDAAPVTIPPPASPPGPSEPPPPPDPLEVHPPTGAVRLEGIALRGGTLVLTLRSAPEFSTVLSIHGLDRWIGEPRTVRQYALGEGKLQCEFAPVRGVASGDLVSFSVEMVYSMPVRIGPFDVSRLVPGKESAAKLGSQWRLLAVDGRPGRVRVHMEATGDVTHAAGYADLSYLPSGHARAIASSAVVDRGVTRLTYEFDLDPDDMRKRTIQLSLYRTGERIEFRNVRIP